MAHLLEDGEPRPIRIAPTVAVRHGGVVAPGTAPNRKALGIALYARLYRLLAERPALLDPDEGARIEKAWAVAYPDVHALIDRAMVERMTELDRMCGYAVAVMRKRSSAALLDVLGLLDPTRIAAMYLALPESRRHIATYDPAWAFHVQRLDLSELRQAADYWDELASEPVAAPPDPDTHDDVLRFARESSRFRAGLAHQLTHDELRCVVGTAQNEERT